MGRKTILKYLKLPEQNVVDLWEEGKSIDEIIREMQWKPLPVIRAIRRDYPDVSYLGYAKNYENMTIFNYKAYSSNRR